MPGLDKQTQDHLRRRAYGQPGFRNRRRHYGHFKPPAYQEGVAILMVTHEAELAKTANRLIRMHDGEVIS